MFKEVSVHLAETNYLCDISDGQHTWQIDEPITSGGGNQAPDPYAALLGSLGSCSAITMKMYAKRKGWDIEKIEIKLSMTQKILLDEKVTIFTREITVHGNIDHEQTQRLHQIVKACPVSKILEGKVDIETRVKKATDDYTTAG